MRDSTKLYIVGIIHRMKKRKWKKEVKKKWATYILYLGIYVQSAIFARNWTRVARVQIPAAIFLYIFLNLNVFCIYDFLHRLEKSNIAIRFLAVREPLETLSKSQHYRIEGVKGGP